MFKLEIETGNAAFDDGGAQHEIARILRDVADRVERAGAPPWGRGLCCDINGNKVGHFTLTED